MTDTAKLDLRSMSITDDQKAKLKQLFPEVFNEDKIDFDKLKQTLGEDIDTGEERFGMTWPGKTDCFKVIQTPSIGTLKPAKDESVNWDTTENLFIEGDNLEVLKLLQGAYYGKVKMIYIDPPYNTGKEFIYPDNYSESLETYLAYTGQKDEEGRKFTTNAETSGRYHSKWLNMMYPRLFLARNLLRDDGVIFISIDDNEVKNLRAIMDDIFGEENFVALISVENNPKGRKNSKFISTSNDYCLIYAKEKNSSYFTENIPKNINDMTLDENGNYIHNSGKRVLVGENSFNKEVADPSSEKHYSVYYNSEESDIVIKKESSIDEMDVDLTSSGYNRYISHRDGAFIENTYTKTKLLDLFDEEALEFKENKIFEKNFSGSIRLKSMLTNKEYDALVNNEKCSFKIDVKTTSAGTCLKELFETKDSIFTAPKNIGLIKLLATLFEEKDFIVLDFFAGSATTAHALMQLNYEDGGRRKYIVSQLPEICDKKSEASKAGYKNIADIGKERIRRVIKKIQEERATKAKESEGKLPGMVEEKADLDLGFRVFKLDTSNFNIWDGTVDESGDMSGQIEMFINHIDPDASDEDILYEILLKTRFPLTTQIEELQLAGQKVYSVANKALLICLDRKLTKEVISEMARLQPARVVCLDAGFADNDQLKTNAVQIMKSHNVEDFRTV